MREKNHTHSAHLIYIFFTFVKFIPQLSDALLKR